MSSYMVEEEFENGIDVHVNITWNGGHFCASYMVWLSAFIYQNVYGILFITHVDDD